jgi:MSHA biogenesis protein MshL
VDAAVNASSARRALAHLALAAACGCAGGPSADAESSGYSAIERAPEPPPLEPRLVWRPDAAPRPPALRLLEETRFDLDVQDAELRPLLIGLIRHSPFSAMVSPAVSGQVTANLQRTSLRELLDQLVVPRGYAYQIRGNTLIVEASPLETRTYAIEYPSYKRQGSSDLTVYGAMGTSHDIGGGSGGSGGGGGGSAQDSSTSAVKTSQDLDFWEELEGALRALVFGGADPAAASSGERQVLVAAQSGLVLLRAEHRIQDEARGLLEEMLRSNQRQVLIDTRILEVTLSDDLDLGVELEYSPSPRGSTGGAIGRLIDETRRKAAVLTGLGGADAGGFTIGIASDSLSARLRALAEQTDVRVVSTPRVATLNNHQALIKVVRNQVFFIAQNDVTVVEGVASAVTTEFVPQVVPIGVTLDVTPRIGEDGQITLHIHPSVSEVVSIETQPKIGDNSGGSLPVIDLRETDTVVRVSDGETIVMGGLIRSRELDQERKVPLLGDLPLIGSLFRSTHVEELRTELVILLTPRVLEGPRVTELTSASLDSLGALDELRLTRRPRSPWWRKPMKRSYGSQ